MWSRMTPWALSMIWAFAWQTAAAIAAGDPIAARTAAEEGRDLADAIGDRYGSLVCRLNLGFAQLMQGDLAGAVAHFGAVVHQADAAHAASLKPASLLGLGTALAYQDEVSAARTAGEAALEGATELGEYFLGLGYSTLALAALASGDVKSAQDSSSAAWQHLSVQPQTAAFWLPFIAQAALAGGDLAAARRWADEAVSTTTGWHLMVAMTTRARVTIAQGETEQAEVDAHEALACAAEVGAYLGISDTLECLGALAGDAGSHREATRLFGAAEVIRHRIGVVRFPIHQAGYEASVAALRDALGEHDFDAAWAEGAALSTEEAIGYAQRGRGERKRPATGWASLTPAERDVVRLVSEGLANSDIATRLFVSPRTVQTHLTHVYTKLGLTSRVQLVQEAARHT
jgi:DNA-binding CsgD family transcriptional regulator